MLWLNLVEIIVKLFGNYMFYDVDNDGNIYLYVDNIIALKNKSYQIDLTGRGLTLEDAAFQYIKLLLDKRYVLRLKYRQGYYTQRIRLVIWMYIYINVKERLLYG